MKLFQIEKLQSLDNMHLFASKLEPSHDIFKGHFPQSPVVPGVCTMEMIKDCCADLLSRPVRFEYVKEVKFLSAIVPFVHEELQVSIELDQQMNLKAEVCFEDKTMMKLRASVI